MERVLTVKYVGHEGESTECYGVLRQEYLSNPTRGQR